ncbi:MAG: hypothetical protein JNM91_07270 [Flavobacteriales bacterium]|nr:hypothetical protein [Flavobacteriales bacterium]
MPTKTGTYASMRSALLLAVALCVAGCKKEVEVVPDNQPPDYSGVATVITSNYVNRLFIDLLGREPLDAEMAAEVAVLEASGLSADARAALVNKLMTSTAFLEDDSSYSNKYYIRQIELYRARCLEGVSDEFIEGAIGTAQQNALADSLAGNIAGANASNLELQRLLDLKSARWEYRDGTIGIQEVMRRMVFNSIYDQINMNSFNFINATFDNLLLRFPTEAEFDQAYSMVDGNTAAVLFGQSGQNKSDYAHIVTHTAEFDEGMIRWCYRTFLGREPSTSEVYVSLAEFRVDHDLQRVQRRILTTDEYANIQP